MKLKKSEESFLVNSLKNMKISSKKRRQIWRNIQTGGKLLSHNNDDRSRTCKSCRPFTLNLSRNRHLRAHHDGDNSSPTRAYHSDSETVVRKDKETAYRSQSNLNYEADLNRVIVFCNPPTSTDEQSDYVSSESSYPIIRNDSRISTPHPEIQLKRFSLRESSTSLFGSILIDANNKSTIVERSPSLQHILCSSIDASPSFRTPMSTVSGNCDQLTATTTSSRVSCSSGYSHSGVFNTGYSSDDFHLLQLQRISSANNNECTVVTKRDSYSPWNITNNSAVNYFNNRPNCSYQPHSLSSDVDLSRQQIIPNSSHDSSATMDDLSSYMDLMIHIPKMHL